MHLLLPKARRLMDPYRFRRPLLCCAVAFLLAGAARAQPAPAQQAFALGLEAYEAGEYQKTRRLLQTLFDTNPALVGAGGSVAYWLGRSLEHVDGSPAAHAVWYEGLQALGERRSFDVAMADAYVRGVYRQEDEEAQGRAAVVYLTLLQYLDEPLAPAAVAVLHRHAAQILPLLPDTLRAELVAEADPDAEALSFHGEAPGARLIAWWRSQDPLPGTLKNERVAEHLQRVAHAEAQFADPDRLSGLDDRGLVYVRLGTPYHKRSIGVRDPAVMRKIYRLNAFVSPRDVPENEGWFDRPIDYYAFYCFVEEDERYRVAETYDLLPASVRRGLTSSARGQRRSEAAITFLRELYKELSFFHPDFAGRYMQVDRYAGMMAEADRSQEATRWMGRAAANAAAQSGGVSGANDREGEFGQEHGNAGPRVPSTQTLYDLSSMPRPHEFAMRVVMEGKQQDHVASRQREIRTPPQRTEVLDAVEPFPVAARAARFLDADGSTRTEIYWSPLPGGLSLPPEEARRASRALLINLRSVQRNADHRARRFAQERYLIQEIPDTEDATLATQRVVLRGDTALYHVGLQWDLYRADPAATGRADGSPGPFRLGTHRFDSLRALARDEQTLEMSDLVPVVAASESALLDAASSTLEELTPYPFSAISTTQLGLYFEVYRLAFGADDQTRYTVEYEVRREGADGSVLRRLFRRGGDEERTVARTTYTGAGRTTREFILLDLQELGDAERLTLLVRVKDETTGQEATRTLSFEVNA